MKGKCIVILCILLSCAHFMIAQATIIGQGNNTNIKITASDEQNKSTAANTLNSQGFLPNLNAASRFLSQATFGSSYEAIEDLSTTGFENWIENQLNTPVSFSIVDKVIEYKRIKNIAQNTPDEGALDYYWKMAWWHYTMTSADVLRQRIAFALSEFFVISQFSSFGENAYALASYYDMLLDNSFGNYRELLEDVTYHPAMGVYLTYLNNPKTDTVYNLDWSTYPPDTLSTQYVFPDENYAREVMQLFSIGLFELEIDGSKKWNGNNNSIPTYDNETIAEFSKVFTGLTWSDAEYFGAGTDNWEETFLYRLKMENEYHEPGAKSLLNGYVLQDRYPVDGNADISDALDNIFNHPNVGPFLGKFLIQRLVTSNPSPEYVTRVAEAFNGDSPYGSARGDLQAVIKAILLDEEARSCFSAEDITYGKLREPLVRYIQLGRAFDVRTNSGDHRNALYTAYHHLQQIPLASPSVFNFFQSDYKPIGHIQNQDKVAPEFQLTNTQTISGYLNGLTHWLFHDQYTDPWRIYDNEPDSENHRAIFDFDDEMDLVADDNIPQLVKRLNMILAHGKLSDQNMATIVDALIDFQIIDRDCLLDCTPYCGDDMPGCDDTPLPDCVMYCEDEILQSKLNRVKLAIYLIMSSPEYLINR